MEKIKPIHPGEILKEEFLIPLDISQYKLSHDLGVSQMKISEIVRGKRSVTTDTALRLSKYFGNSPEFWLGLQADYNLEVEKDNAAMNEALDKITPLLNKMMPEMG